MRPVSILIAAAMVGSCTNAADAQISCGIITNYLNNPPNSFVSERGQKMKDNVWRSISPVTNGSCRIEFSPTLNQHQSACVFTATDEQAALSFYSKGVSELSSCFAAFSDPWDKTSSSRSTSDGRYISTTWQKEMNDQTFRFSIVRQYDSYLEKWLNRLVVTFTE